MGSICIYAGGVAVVLLGLLFVVRALRCRESDFNFESASSHALNMAVVTEFSPLRERAGIVDRIRPRAWRHVCGVVSCLVGFGVLFGLGMAVCLWGVAGLFS